MKRFLSFHGANYYPCGGMKDFVSDFDTIPLAVEAIEEEQKTAHHSHYASEPWRFDWGTVWDSERRENVWSNGKHEISRGFSMIDIPANPISEAARKWAEDPYGNKAASDDIRMQFLKLSGVELTQVASEKKNTPLTDSDETHVA